MTLPSTVADLPSRERRLRGFSRWSWAAFGRRLRGPADPKTEEGLAQAHWRLTPDEYRGIQLGSTVLAAVAALVGTMLGLLFAGAHVTPLFSLGLGVGLVGATAASVYVVVGDLPHSRALTRGKEIGRDLPSAVHFIAAMSCADVPVDDTFRELAAQSLYGEVAAEASWIVRDLDLLGADILSALRAAARRSPSAPLTEFLQGVVTTAESGGDLRSYFLAQADRFERERSVRARSEIERLGTYAEAYVTVAVAFPLFLLVMLAIFTLIEGSAGGLLLFVWVTALGIIPAAEIAFAFVFRSLAEDR